MVIWDDWTIFVKIFGGHEMSSDCRENICFCEIYREHLRESMGKKNQMCVEGPKMSYLGEIMWYWRKFNYFLDFFGENLNFLVINECFSKTEFLRQENSGNFAQLKKLSRKWKKIFSFKPYRGCFFLFKFPLESEGTKRGEGPSYRGQLHNNSNLILEPHLFAIWA